MTIKIVFDSFDEMMRYADRLKNGDRKSVV